MESDELNEAIGKIQDIYDQGEEILELIEVGPTGQHAKHGAIEAAAKEVAKN